MLDSILCQSGWMAQETYLNHQVMWCKWTFIYSKFILFILFNMFLDWEHYNSSFLKRPLPIFQRFWIFNYCPSIIDNSFFLYLNYSIVKDSSADLGVNSKIVQVRPTVKAVCTKMSKKFFCIFVNILIFLNESREDHFEYFEYLRKTALY